MIALNTRILLTCCLAATVAACSTAADDAPAVGSMITTGSLVSAKPRPGECARLAHEIAEELQRLQSLPAVAKAQRAAPPATLQSALAWLSAEPGQGVPAMSEFNVQRTRIVGLEAVSRGRGCLPIAIDAPLAEIETAMTAR